MARRLLVAALAVALTIITFMTTATAETQSWQHVPVPAQVRPQAGLNEAVALGPDRAWVVGADAATGARVAFGANEAADGIVTDGTSGAAGAEPVELGDAIAASWAIPGWFPPVRIGGNDYGAGSGNSKKEAEQEAAADAWRKLSAPSTVTPEAAAREAAPAESAAPDAQQLQSQTGA